MRRFAVLSCVILAGPLAAAPPALDRYGDPLPEAVLARCGTVRFTHSADLEQVAFTADGKAIVFVGRDSVVGRWDAETGRELARVTMRRPPLQDAWLSAGGKLLVMPSTNGGLSVWDTATSRELCQLPSAKNAPLLVVSWLEDGRTLLAVDGDGGIHVLDIASGQEVGKWAIAGERIYALAAMPGGKRVAVITDADHIFLRDALTGNDPVKLENVQLRPGNRTSSDGLVFSPDGKLLVLAQWQSPFGIWDMESGKPKAWPAGPAPGTRFVGGAFSPDSKTLAVADFSGSVRFLNAATGKETAVLAGSRALPSLRFSPDGRRLAAFGDGPTIDVWDVAQRRSLRPDAGHRSSVAFVAFLDDTRLVTAQYDGQLAAWHAKTGRLLDRVTKEDRHIVEALVAPSADAALVANTGGEVSRWRPGANAPIAQVVANSGKTYRHSLTADGRVLASFGDQLGVVVTEVATGKRIGGFPLGREEVGAVFQISPDGQLLAKDSGEVEDGVRLWKIAGGKPYRTLAVVDPEEGGVRTAAFSPTNRAVATVGKTGDVRIWEVASGALRRRIRRADGIAAKRAAFTRDGRGLALGSLRGEIMYIDLMSGMASKVFTGHRGGVMGLAFSPDGWLLASGSTDTTALVWNVAKLRPSAEFKAITLAEAEQRWRELATADAALADQAIGALVSAPAVTVPLLAVRLKPAQQPPRERLEEWVKQLDDARFAVREQATQALAPHADELAELLTAARAGAGPEGRRRIDTLLRNGESQPSTERLQALRGLEVAELIGNADARRLLDSLATQPSDVWLQREAAAVRDRLARRNASP